MPKFLDIHVKPFFSFEKNNMLMFVSVKVTNTVGVLNIQLKESSQQLRRLTFSEQTCSWALSSASYP